MADICSVASVCAFLKKSNTMLSSVDDVLVAGLFILCMSRERCMCVFETGGWKDDVVVSAIIDMIASSDMAVRLSLLSCVDDLIFVM